MIFKLIDDKYVNNLKILNNYYCLYCNGLINIRGRYFNFGNIEIFAFETINIVYIYHNGLLYKIYVPFVINGLLLENIINFCDDKLYMVGWHSIKLIEKDNIKIIKEYTTLELAEIIKAIFFLQLGNRST